MAIEMTVNELMKLLDSLDVSVKRKQIVFCHNPSKDVYDLDEHQIEYLQNIANGNDVATDESIANIQELNLAFALWKMLVNPCASIVVMSKDNSLS